MAFLDRLTTVEYGNIEGKVVKDVYSWQIVNGVPSPKLDATVLPKEGEITMIEIEDGTNTKYYLVGRKWGVRAEIKDIKDKPFSKFVVEIFKQRATEEEGISDIIFDSTATPNAVIIIGTLVPKSG